MNWEKASEIPDEVISSAISFAEDVARAMPEGEEADEVVERVFAAIHPKLPSRITTELLKDETGRTMCLNPNEDRRRINAIKEVRAATGYGLKEAKEFVEKVETDGHCRLPAMTREKRLQLRENLRDTGYLVC